MERGASDAWRFVLLSALLYCLWGLWLRNRRVPVDLSSGSARRYSVLVERIVVPLVAVLGPVSVYDIDRNVMTILLSVLSTTGFLVALLANAVAQEPAPQVQLRSSTRSIPFADKKSFGRWSLRALLIVSSVVAISIATLVRLSHDPGPNVIELTVMLVLGVVVLMFFIAPAFVRHARDEAAYAMRATLFLLAAAATGCFYFYLRTHVMLH